MACVITLNLALMWFICNTGDYFCLHLETVVGLQIDAVIDVFEYSFHNYPFRCNNFRLSRVRSLMLY